MTWWKPAAWAIALLLLAGSAAAQVRSVDPLNQARQLYNDQHYDEAIKAAETARLTPALAPAASIVLARAHLERYRMSAEATDLTAAREALKQIDAASLSPRDEVEFLIGLGETLYVDDQSAMNDRYSAAAQQFEVALAHADLLDPRSRDELFDWWALSLDHQAQQGLETERQPLYQRIVDRAQKDLASPDPSASAIYWLAAAAHGIDDLPLAMGAAQAGWIRAGSLGRRGEALRDDLDRLLREVILPERARELAGGGDPRPVLDVLIAHWDELKDQWTRTP